MTFFQAVFLAAVQGITEFLPISSSGHLVLFQKLFHLASPPVLFDVILHLGTLMAILVFFRKELWLLIREWKSKKNQWMFLIAGSIPAGFFGFLLNSKINTIFDSLSLVGMMWVIFGVFLISTRWLIKEKLLQKKAEDIKWTDAIIIGLFQTVALFPGVSRSGSTIIGGLFRNFSREDAFFLSFLLSIPAVLGAATLELAGGSVGEINLGTGIVSVIIAGLVGYFSLKFLKKSLQSDKFYFFGFYCLILGITVLLKIGYL